MVCVCERESVVSNHRHCDSEAERSREPSPSPLASLPSLHQPVSSQSFYPRTAEPQHPTSLPPPPPLSRSLLLSHTPHTHFSYTSQLLLSPVNRSSSSEQRRKRNTQPFPPPPPPPPKQRKEKKTRLRGSR